MFGLSNKFTISSNSFLEFLVSISIPDLLCSIISLFPPTFVVIIGTLHAIASNIEELIPSIKEGWISISEPRINEIISSENTFTIPVKGLKNPSFMLSASLKAKFKKNNDIVHAHNIPSAKAMKNASGKKVLSIHGIFSQQFLSMKKILIMSGKNFLKNTNLILINNEWIKI